MLANKCKVGVHLQQLLRLGVQTEIELARCGNLALSQ